MRVMPNSQYCYMLIVLFLILFSTLSDHSFFAEAANVEVRIPVGANEPGCEKTNECFIPFEVTISVGDTVIWINDDSSSHTVTSGDLKNDVNKIGLDYPNGFNSPLLKSGESWTHTFEKVGVYPYFSMVGLWMTGIVNVESSSIEEEIETPDNTETEVSEKPVISKQNAFIFIDELPLMTISEGDPILITGQLITEDGNPIAGEKIIVETFDVSVTGQEVQAAQKQTTQESKPFFELPNIGGGCLIATATYGTELAPQVQMLREIRDNSVLGTGSGAAFMSAFNSFYYSFSPEVADLERQNPMFREIVRVAITPMISTLAILNYVDIDSEYEMLGYGIGVIMLNAGMYLILPALVMFRLTKLKHKKSVT